MKSSLTDQSWLDIVDLELKKSYMVSLGKFVDDRRKNIQVYPSKSEVFSAFNTTPFNAVKVVILGQDPYHGEGQADGLSFSMKKGVQLPSSLRNIFKQIEFDLNTKPLLCGDLKRWAKQGVFLLNSVLTVEQKKPKSHAGKGWEQFTDFVIRELSDKSQNLVFILWGNHAKSKIKLIDEEKHLVLSTSHPSGLSAYLGFNRCKHFSECNKYLKRHSKKEIDWQ